VQSLLRRLGMVGLVLIAALGTQVLIPASAASASAYGCSGSQIDSYAVRTSWPSGTIYGHIYLYYSSSNGGTNCAVVVATSAGGYGVQKPMDIWMYRCAESTENTPCTFINPRSEDNGNYYYFAGPVKQTNADNHCIFVQANIKYNSKSAYGSSDNFNHITPYGHHCA
jgi:hypothetical protein